MTLKPCKRCGKETTTYVDICRHCGAKNPFRDKDPFTASIFRYFQLIRLVLVFIVIGIGIQLAKTFGIAFGIVVTMGGFALIVMGTLLTWNSKWREKAWENWEALEEAESAWKQEQEKKLEKRLEEQEKTRAEREEERRRKEAVANALSEIASTSFLVRSCPSCYENAMYLLSVSPNGRSIEYQCITCNRRQRSAAANPRAQEAVGLFKDFSRYYPNRLVGFTAPLDPLPYEQTVREPISDAMRSQVWRRDGGQCVKCGGKANLQLDHIIPVKKGGATTVNNLQLLCRSCNLAKGTKI